MVYFFIMFIFFLDCKNIVSPSGVRTAPYFGTNLSINHLTKYTKRRRDFPPATELGRSEQARNVQRRMPFITLLSLLIIFWIVLLFADFYLRYTNSERYLNFLEDHRLSFTPFQVRFYLTDFDRHPRLAYAFIKSFDRSLLSSKRSRFLAFWFSIGALISLLCFLLTPLYLFRLLLHDIGSVFIGSSPHPDHQLHSSNTVPHENHDLSLAAPIILPSQHSLLYFPVRQNLHSGITPIFPGLNLPLSHIPIFVFVLILASIVHEAGHAVAAANANVRVTGLGVFLFAIYPGAFTEVEPEQLDRCTCAQKLRIFGAGIWHNIILALFGVLILTLIPIFCFPFYSNSAGIIVEDVDPKSGLFGPTGLQSGHHIQRINQCDVKNISDWARCFATMRDERVRVQSQPGYLAQLKAVAQMTASSEHIQPQPDGEVRCCQEFNVSTATHICFRYLTPQPKNSQQEKEQQQTTTPKPIFPNFPDFDAEFGIKDTAEHQQNNNQEQLRKKRANLKMRYFSQTKSPNLIDDKNNFKLPNRLLSSGSGQKYSYSHACLPAMQITEHALCESPSSNNNGIVEGDLTVTLPPGYVCVVPALYNDTALLRFQVKDQSRPVLFIGYLNEPLHMVEVSELTPRFDIIPWWLPRVVELFARYLITLSLAMGILNAVPCYGLDGQFISTTVVEYFCQNWPPILRKRIANGLVATGTVIFCSNILIGFAKSLFIHY